VRVATTPPRAGDASTSRPAGPYIRASRARGRRSDQNCEQSKDAETRFQGDLAPDLTGAGNRWTTSQLRLRLVDAARFNPETIMPSYYRTDRLVRVGRNFAGKPILSAAEIEDIVAFLATLRD